MSKPVSIALVGIGGYGNTYVNALLDAPERVFTFAAAVDPSPTSCRRLADLQARSVPQYPTLEAFYAAGGSADLAVISTPIFLHARHTALAVANRTHVLCEKPLCSTPDEARAMAEARDAAGAHVAIGYQWSFSRAIRELKRDVLSGLFGRPRRLRTLVLWPRDESYYRRNRWAGAKRDPQGNWVGDSPVNNACAHYLHNMLYVTGGATDHSAEPSLVAAELYRAHAIENYDTAALRCRTRDGAEILFVVSHATSSAVGPVFSYEFERGVVEFNDGPGGSIVARFRDGSTKNYGSPNENREAKLWLTMDAIRSGAPTLCGIEAATPHVQCAWAAQQSMPDIVTFPATRIRVTGEPGKRRTSVEGLQQILERCYAEGTTPSELGADWAVPGREVRIEAPREERAYFASGS
jgi:predicted dehydrogenase